MLVLQGGHQTNLKQRPKINLKSQNKVDKKQIHEGQHHEKNSFPFPEKNEAAFCPFPGWLFAASSLQPAPLQAQVSWPALQAVALCFLPVAGGGLSSFGTGLARFLAAGLASFGAAASFGSGAAASFGSVAGRPAGLASLAGFPNLAHVLQKQWV